MINKEGGIETMDLNKLKEIQAVVFDMDGLMFDTERLWDTLWEPACAALGLPLPADMEKFKAGGRGLAGDNLRRHVAEYIPGDPQKVLDKIWQLADERFARGVPCKKGLKELLAALEDMGLPIFTDLYRPTPQRLFCTEI